MKTRRARGRNMASWVVAACTREYTTGRYNMAARDTTQNNNNNNACNMFAYFSSFRFLFHPRRWLAFKLVYLKVVKIKVVQKREILLTCSLKLLRKKKGKKYFCGLTSALIWINKYNWSCEWTTAKFSGRPKTSPRQNFNLSPMHKNYNRSLSTYKS